MRTLTALLLVLLALPAARADETAPDCEDEQPWIGYAHTDPVRAAYDDLGSPGLIALCEGEHWDGQDTIDDSPGADPNGASGTDPTAASARASPGSGAAYAAANAPLVLRAAVYADGSTIALYVRENTPGNVVATTLTCAGSVTGCSAEEADCDQATYARDASRWRRECSRDNTAITLEHSALP